MAKSTLQAKVGQRIRAIRKEKRLSQEMLAFEADCDVSTIGRLERGELNATIDLIDGIASALRVTPIMFFDFPEAASRDTHAAALRSKVDTVVRQTDRNSVQLLDALMDSLIQYGKARRAK